MDYKGKTLKILFRDKTILNHKIDENPLVRGGEGEIYRFEHKVDEERKNYILKLYCERSKAARNCAKVKCMFNHPVRSHQKNVRFCWPIGLVYDARTQEFYGFAMQEAFPESRDLEILSTYFTHGTIADHYPDHPSWHGLYDLDTPHGRRNRLSILYRWTLAIEELQRIGHIVVGDIKPSNVMCTADGCISIVDIDSMQYTMGDHTYLSTAYSSEYCHRDVLLHKAMLYNLPKNFDAYSLATSYYTILTGTHPFGNVINLPPYNQDKYQKLSAMIKAGLYYRGGKGQFVKPVKLCNLHANADTLSNYMRAMFDRAFTETLDNIPTIEEWIETLRNEL